MRWHNDAGFPLNWLDEDGTRLLVDLNPGFRSSNTLAGVPDFASVGGSLVYFGADDVLGGELWTIEVPDPRQRFLRADSDGDAAVSITITSLTDFLSFAVGMYTTLPAVRWFCLYSALGIAFTYFYYLTFFIGKSF